VEKKNHKNENRPLLKKHSSLEGGNNNNQNTNSPNMTTTSATNSPSVPYLTTNSSTTPRNRSGSYVNNLNKIQREDIQGESPEPKLKPYGQNKKKKLLGTSNGVEQTNRLDLLDLWIGSTPNQKSRITGKRKGNSFPPNDQELLIEDIPKKRRSSKLKFTPITLPGSPYEQLKQKSPKDEKKLTIKREKRLSAPSTPHRSETLPRASSSNDTILRPLRKDDKAQASLVLMSKWSSDLTIGVDYKAAYLNLKNQYDCLVRDHEQALGEISNLKKANREESTALREQIVNLCAIMEALKQENNKLKKIKKDDRNGSIVD